MTEETVESKEEIKKRAEKMKKDTANKGEEVKDKIDTAKEKTEDKLQDAKEDTKDKIDTAKEKTEDKLQDAKEDTKDKIDTAKEKTEDKLQDAKEDTKGKIEDIKENLEDVKDETSARLEEYRTKSEKEGKNPAEKFLSDIITGIVHKKEDVNQAMSKGTGKAITIPLTDVLETEDSITIIVDTPGLSKEDIEIGISLNSVEITANYEEGPPIDDAKFIQKERGNGTVNRVIDLPVPIAKKKASAAYKNCKLTITLPKKQKELTKIDIQ